MSMPTSSSSLSGCPFAGACGSGAALPLGHTPIGGSPQAPAPAPAATDERAVAVRALADRGMSPAQIAPLLGMDEAAVAAIVSGGGGQGRVLGNEMQAKLDKLLDEDPEFVCPVSLVLFVEPVVASDGFMYEKASLQALLRNRMASPMTREELKADFLPARQRRSATMEFRQTRSEELLAFVAEVAQVQPAMSAEALQRATEYIEVLQVRQVPSLAARAASLWRSLGRPVPLALQAC